MHCRDHVRPLMGRTFGHFSSVNSIWAVQTVSLYDCLTIQLFSLQLYHSLNSSSSNNNNNRVSSQPLLPSKKQNVNIYRLSDVDCEGSCCLLFRRFRETYCFWFSWGMNASDIQEGWSAFWPIRDAAVRMLNSENDCHLSTTVLFSQHWTGTYRWGILIQLSSIPECRSRVEQ